MGGRRGVDDDGFGGLSKGRQGERKQSSEEKHSDQQVSHERATMFARD